VESAGYTLSSFVIDYGALYTVRMGWLDLGDNLTARMPCRLRAPKSFAVCRKE
jgi:hypothetical protein